MERNLAEWAGTIPYSIEQTKEALDKLLTLKSGFVNVQKNESFGSYTFSKTIPILQGMSFNITIKPEGSNTEIKITNKNLSGSRLPDVTLSTHINEFNTLLAVTLEGKDISEVLKQSKSKSRTATILAILIVGAIVVWVLIKK